eukprot:485924_1
MFLFIIMLVQLQSIESIKNITISTTLGNITGIAYDNNYSLFAGIPYTENAPTGNNRFKPSIMRTSSYTSNPFDATSFGSPCLQVTGAAVGLGDEDCLTLNIWTKNITTSNPVMVWIHGGGHNTGSSVGVDLMDAYDGKHFATKDIVFVSMNYRLGMLGFMGLNEIYQETNTTNGALMGEYDQIIALQFIQTYISQFGGNPNAVTIFGESAGGFSVGHLLFSPIAANLFDKAIIQSGAQPVELNFLHGPLPKSVGEQNAMNVLTATFGNTSLSYLRSLPATSFIGLPPILASDGYILPNDDLFSGTLNAQKIMIGSNSFDQLWAWPFDGYGLIVPQSPNNNEELRQFINSYFGQSDDALYNKIINKYFKPDLFYDVGTYNKYQTLWYSMSADALFV